LLLDLPWQRLLHPAMRAGYRTRATMWLGRVGEHGKLRPATRLARGAPWTWMLVIAGALSGSACVLLPSSPTTEVADDAKRKTLRDLHEYLELLELPALDVAVDFSNRKQEDVKAAVAEIATKLRLDAKPQANGQYVISVPRLSQVDLLRAILVTHFHDEAGVVRLYYGTPKREVPRESPNEVRVPIAMATGKTVDRVLYTDDGAYDGVCQRELKGAPFKFDQAVGAIARPQAEWVYVHVVKGMPEFIKVSVRTGLSEAWDGTSPKLDACQPNEVLVPIAAAKDKTVDRVIYTDDGTDDGVCQRQLKRPFTSDRAVSAIARPRAQWVYAHVVNGAPEFIKVSVRTGLTESWDGTSPKLDTCP
jgi:hypothetical protein